MRKILSTLCTTSLCVANASRKQIQYRDGDRNYYRQYQGGRWNAYRGDRYRRDGYRRHNDAGWYPLAAFGAGTIIGGAIANQGPRRVYHSSGSAHVQWCYDKRQCYSPYSQSARILMAGLGRQMKM